jgi:hypothetical protein
MNPCQARKPLRISRIFWRPAGGPWSCTWSSTPCSSRRSSRRRSGNGIDEARTNIRRVKDTLRAWGVAVDDCPDDEEQPATPNPAPSRQGVLVRLGAAVAVGVVLLRRQTPSDALNGKAGWAVCGRASAVLPGSIAPARGTAAALARIKWNDSGYVER